MLNSFLFYNTEKTKLSLEEIDASSHLFADKQISVKLKVPKLSNSSLTPVIDNHYLYLSSSSKVYKSTTPLSLFYLVKIKEDSKDSTYNLLSLENKIQYTMIVRRSCDLMFKITFSSYFIYTDFNQYYNIIEKKPDGFMVENFEAELKALDDRSLPLHMVKCYDKKHIQYESLNRVLLESLNRLRVLETDSCFLPVFFMFETDTKFILTFERPVGVTVKDFVDANKNNFHYKQVIEILLSLVDICENMEKKNLQICVVRPESTIISFEGLKTQTPSILNHKPQSLKHTLNDFMAKGNKASLYTDLKKIVTLSRTGYDNNNTRLKSSYILNSPENMYSRTSNDKRNKSNGTVPTDHILKRKSNKEPHSLTAGVQGLSFCLTNVEFIFDTESNSAKNDVYVKVGFSDICFLSNCYTSLSKNLNVLIVGLFYYYMLSSVDLGPSYDIVSSKVQETVFFNLSSKILANMTKMHKQILYYVFTSDNIQSLRRSLENLYLLDEKLTQIERDKDESVNIVTSVTELNDIDTNSKIHTGSMSYTQSEQQSVEINPNELIAAGDNDEFFGPRVFESFTGIAPKFNDMTAIEVDNKKSLLSKTDQSGSCHLLKDSSIKRSVNVFGPKIDSSGFWRAEDSKRFGGV